MFFDPQNFSERKLSMEVVREWAGEIAGAYLNSAQAPTDTLCKIAQTEELTPHVIGVLAAEANKEIHRVKFATVKDKYMAADFPLADAKQAISRLQVDSGETKIAVEMPEPKFESRLPDLHGAFGVKPEVMDKTASVRHEVKTAEAKMERLCEKLADAVTIGKFEVENAEKVFIKQARQMILSNSFDAPSRMKMLGSLEHFVKESGVESGRPLLAKLAYVLGAEGLLTPQSAKDATEYFMSKEADMKAPEELISNWLPGQIINGNHPLYISLKTFDDVTEKLRRNTQRSQIVDDQLKIIRQRVRAL